MTILDYAIKRMLEEEHAHNEADMRYWAAYIDGARAQKNEDEIGIQAQESCPMLLKELHDMMDIDEAEPLWIFLFECNHSYPAIIDRVDGEIIAAMGVDVNECLYYEKDYGKTWLMYHEKRV